MPDKGNGSVMKRALSFFCLLLCMVLLSGCVAGVHTSLDSSAALPAVQLPFDAPTGDESTLRSVTCRLYLPDASGTSLIAVHKALSLHPYRWYLDDLANALFDYEGTEAQPLPRAESLSLSGPIEVSCGIATVNLTAQALALSHEQLYTVFQALTNTLCQFEDVTAVNLLISGVQPGIDVASQTPAGALHENHVDDLSILWSRAQAQRNAASGTQRLIQDVTLYFPAPAGMGVVCENRTLGFSAVSLPQMAGTLLEALSEGPRQSEALPQFPSLTAYLSSEPAVNESAGEKVLTLRFSEQFNHALLENGIPRSCMAASIVLTATTYLPGIAGVEMYIGDEKISTLTPEGTYQGAGETIVFADGVMRRDQFGIFLLSRCSLYFADAQGALQKVYRAIPYYDVMNASRLIEEMMLGPRFYDWTEENLHATLPSQATQGDLMGTGYGENATALINFSPRYLDLCQGMTPQDEQIMVYSIVNTLTELSSVQEVCFFINSKQPSTFAGALSLPGTFLRNTDLIAR